MSDQYVNGRRALLQCLDSLLAEERNIKAYKEVFQNQIENEPMKFFQNVVMPLMPKEGLAMTDSEGQDGTGQVVINFVPVTPKPKE